MSLARPQRTAVLLPLLVLLAGCARARVEQAPAARASGTAAPASSVFSREAFGARVTMDGRDAGAAELPVPATADPAALDELLAAAAKAGAGTPPADRSGVLGTDTGVQADAGAERAPPGPARAAKVSVGKILFEPGMSSAGLERAARAQLYWALTQRCRDGDGAILPPEVVRLELVLDRDGYIVPSSIHATAKEPRFAAAARCMGRELAASTFRAPPAARGEQQWVAMDVPSVD